MGHAGVSDFQGRAAGDWDRPSSESRIPGQRRPLCRLDPRRATIANMAPEYGATMGFFPIDVECVNYLRATGRSEEHCRAYENYYREQKMFGMPKKGEIAYSVELELDLGTVVPSVAGPKRPQDRIELPKLKEEFLAAFAKPVTENGFGKSREELSKSFAVCGRDGFRPGGGTQD